MKEKVITVKEIDLCTESFGDEINPAVLLIAGATVSMLFWDEEFCRKLADKGFFVIRYDNRDVGKSTCYAAGTTPYDVVDLTNDAVSVLDGYGIDAAHFVGLSLGGMIAQIAAVKYPGRVKTLTLMSTMPWGDSDLSIPEMDSRIVDFQNRAGTVDWTNEDRVADYLLGGAVLMGGKKRFDSQRSERLIRAEFNRAKNYLSMYNHAGLQGGEAYYNRLDEIRHSTLIIHGTEDRICHFKNSLVLTDKIKGSKFLKLDGTGHELHVEDWDAIIEGIKNICTTHSCQ